MLRRNVSSLRCKSCKEASVCSCIAPPLLQMRVQPFQPSRTRSSALSSEGCRNSSSGESSELFSSLRVLSTIFGLVHHRYLSPYCCCDQDRFSLQALCDKGHCHRHGLHIFRSLQCASVLANTCNVLHHALLHHNEEADQGKYTQDRQISSLLAKLSQKISVLEAFFLRKCDDDLDLKYYNVSLVSSLFPAHDQVQILTLHTWKEDIQRQGRNGENVC